MIRLRAELASIGTIDKETIKEVDETKQRYDFLSKELTDLETASENLKNLIQDLDKRIHTEFKSSFKKINDAFNTYFGTMFGGGKAALKLSGAGHNAISYGANPEVHPQDPMDSPTTTEKPAGIDIDISIPRKKIKHLDMLSGGEKSLVSLAALFSLISISSPPFLLLDEIDAALDDENTKRFSDLVKKFSNQTQFVLITHNKITMEIADILYGITMSGDGISKVLSLKLDKA